MTITPFNVFGGYNEDYFGYGREDSDIWYRANHLLNCKIPYLGYPLVHYYHHWHPDNGPNPLNREDKHANVLLDITMRKPEEVIRRLLLVKNMLGNKESPTLIYPENYIGEKHE